MSETHGTANRIKNIIDTSTGGSIIKVKGTITATISTKIESAIDTSTGGNVQLVKETGSSKIFGSVDTSTGGNVQFVKDSKLNAAVDTSTGGYVIYTQDKNITLSKDTASNTIGIIDIQHKEIHEGKHFIYASDMTATASTDFMRLFLKGGGSTEPARHIIFEVSADKAGKVYFREGILTSGGGGTTVTILNNNRNSTEASKHSIIRMPTTKSSSTGTLLWAGFVGANNPPVKIGGCGSNRMEFVLASSRDYYLMYDPSANATNVIMVSEWYEE